MSCDSGYCRHMFGRRSLSGLTKYAASVIVISTFLQPLTSAGENAASEVKAAAPEKQGPKSGSVEEKTDDAYLKLTTEILDFLKEKHPEALKRIEQDRETLINDILEKLKLGLHYRNELPEKRKTAADSKGDAENAGQAGKSTICSAVMIATNKILYMRVDYFSADSLEQFRNDLKMSSNLAKKPVGIILDLRSCRGNDFVNALKALSLICKPKDLPKLPTSIKLEKQVYNIPCAVLIGANTCGAGEVFAKYLSGSGRSLSFGGNSAGRPFPMKTFNLKSGGYLFYPEIPAFYDDREIVPLTPKISVKAYPQVNYKDISGKSGSESTDKCLERADDLLISIEALRQKKKPQKNKAAKPAGKSPGKGSGTTPEKKPGKQPEEK